MTERLYIAGPMTGYPDLNYPAFRAAATQLGALGYPTENPADNDDGTARTWSDYLRLAIRQMLTCDGVALLDGWEDSKGARLEVHIATEIGMPVRLVAAWLNPGEHLGEEVG